jgi:hypothetical protein
MAWARSGSIFCWPRAVFFLLLRELVCLPLRAVVAAVDFGCVAAWVCLLELGVLALGFALLGFEVTFVVFEAVLEDCAKVSPGKMQAQISAKAQPVLSHSSSFAQCFCFCSNVKPQKRTPLRWFANLCDNDCTKIKAQAELAM